MVEPVLFDTNIIIDLFAGIGAAEDLVLSCADRAISVITWMEVMSGVIPEEEHEIAALLRPFHAIPLSPRVAAEAVHIRRETKLKLPDAIILATAHIEGRLLLTRNTKDFEGRSTRVRIPYKL